MYQRQSCYNKTNPCILQNFVILGLVYFLVKYTDDVEVYLSKGSAKLDDRQRLYNTYL